MKKIWILLVMSLTFAEKLDRTYLPPPGSSIAGGSPGAISVPIVLPKTKYSSVDEEFSVMPELVKGINRVSSGRADDDISTNKPNITSDFSYFTSPTKATTTDFEQSSPFPNSEKDSTLTIYDINYDPGKPSSNLQNTQEIYVETLPQASMFDEQNRVYLPSYAGINTHSLPFITLPPPFNTENREKDEYKFIQSDASSDKNTSEMHPNSPNYFVNDNNVFIPNNHHTSTTFHFSTTTPTSSTKIEAFIVNHVDNQRPERIQIADRQSVILNYEQSMKPEGYAYNYDTSNGIHGNEHGNATDGVKTKGSYSYIGNDGNFYQVEYTADENGFMPKGAHLPTVPPIPKEILKVIEQAARDKEAGIYDDGSYKEEKYGFNKYRKGYPKTNNLINEVNYEKNDLNSKNENTKNNKIDKSVETHENRFHDIDSINDNKNYTDGTNMVSTKTLDKNKLKTFPLRFSEKEHNFHYETSGNDTEKATAKPFLTPYVIRRGEDSEIQDYDEELGNGQMDTVLDKQSKEYYEDNTNLFDDQELSNKSKHQGSYGDYEPINIDEENDSREFIPGDTPKQQLQYGNRIKNSSHLAPFNEKGYFYEAANETFITLNPRVFYTTSTTVATDFPIGESGPLFHLPSLSNTTSLINDLNELNTVSSLPTQTVAANSELTSVYPGPYNITNPTTYKTPQTSRPVLTRFGIPYTPATESSNYYHDIYNSKTNPINISSKDFTGPKQPQRFDPKTGYHYK